MDKDTKETLNKGDDEKVVPSDSGQSENQTDIESEDISQDVNEVENTKDNTDENIEDEDTVKLSKAEFEKMKRDLENYKRGLLAAKKKSFKLPLPIQKKADEDTSLWDDETDKKYVTKEEYYRGIERTAIEKALADKSMPELDSAWDDIMSYYANRHGNTVDGYIRNIKDAYYLWKRDNASPVKEKPITAKKDISTLAQDTQISKGKNVKNTPPRKSLFPKSKPMEEWYK